MKTVTSTRRLTHALAIGIISLPCLLATTVHAQTNLAAGKTITASTTVSGFPGSNSVDGNQGTYWESQNNAFPQSLTVDLGSAYNVNRVVLKLPNNWGSRTQNISVAGSVNGSTYSTLVNTAGYTFNPSSSNNVTINVPGSSARYLRLNVT